MFIWGFIVSEAGGNGAGPLAEGERGERRRKREGMEGSTWEWFGLLKY